MQLRKLYLPADPAKNRQSFAASLLLSSLFFSGFFWNLQGSNELPRAGESLYRLGGPGATPLAPGPICKKKLQMGPGTRGVAPGWRQVPQPPI